MNILKYKNYEGTAEIDLDRQVCHGKLLFIDDLVTYQAESPSALRVEFEAAVDDYLQTCSELGREPQLPLSGTWNVRATPQLHREMKLRAIADRMSLNEACSKAFECYLSGGSKVTNHNTYVVSSDTSRASAVLASYEGDRMVARGVTRVLQ